MRFSTIFTVLAAGAMAFASAVPEIVEKRSVDQFQTAWTNLGNQCSPIIQKFNGCSNDDCTNEIVLELVAAINACNTATSGYTGGPGNLALGTVVADVVAEIAVGLNNHKNQCGSGCPNIITTYAQVDVSLSTCLTTVFNLCAGLVGYVTPL